MEKTPRWRSRSGRSRRSQHELPPLLWWPGRERGALDIIKRRCRAIGLPPDICNHSFRGTGLTLFMDAGGDMESARQLANHASVKTTQLYNRSGDRKRKAEVERVQLEARRDNFGPTKGDYGLDSRKQLETLLERVAREPRDRLGLHVGAPKDCLAARQTRRRPRSPGTEGLRGRAAEERAGRETLKCAHVSSSR